MADLFTLSELASYLQRDLDTSSATLAQQGAQDAVRAYCRQEFTSTTYTAAKLPIRRVERGWRVDLPQRPVTAVTTVAVNGTTYTLGTDYAWNGVDPYILLAQLTWTSAAFQDQPVATVTYTAGYASVPDDVKAVALAVAGRAYDNPQGLRTTSVDDYSETRAGADDDLAGFTLLAAERHTLKPYRRTAGSVTLR